MPTQTKFICPSGGVNVDLSGIFEDLNGGTSYGTQTKFKVGSVDFTGLFHASTNSEDKPDFNTGFKITVAGVVTDLSSLFRRRGYVGISITSQPSSQTKNEGQTATFSVTATASSGTITYQWKKWNGSSYADISGETTNSYTTPTLTASDDGNQYICTVSAGGSTLNSSAATLTVHYVTITDDPDSGNFNVTNSPVLSVTATVKPTPALYQWQYSNDNSSWFDETNATSSTLTISNINTADEGYYRCRVRNNNSSVTEFSQSAYIQVYFQSTITVQPTQSPAVIVGNGTNNVSMTIGAVGKAAPTYQWQENINSTWTNLTNINRISGATTATLTLSNVVTADDLRQFRCIINNTNATGGAFPTTTSDTVTLNISYAPVITVQPVSTIYNDNDDVVYSVTATGNPSPTYQWQRAADGVTWLNLTTNGLVTENSIAGITTNTLSFKCQATRADYQYRCVVTNAVTSVNSNAATLYVNPKITTNLTTTKTVTVASGQNTVAATFTIAAAGSAVLSYAWYKKVPGGSFAVVGTDSPTFTENVDEDDSNSEYKCTVSSSLSGTVAATSATSTLTVNLTPISISSFLGNAVANPTVNEGEQLTYSVTALGSGTLNYNFKKNGVSVQNGTSSTYAFNVALADHGASYTCTVSSSKTSLTAVTSSASTLTVNYITITQVVVEEDGVQQTVTSNEQVFVVDEGDLVKLYITAAGRPGVNYEWKKWNGSAYIAISGAHISGINTSVLTFNTILSSDETFYACFINNGAGLTANTENTREVYLDVVSVTITAQPTTITRTTTQSAVFSVTFNAPGSTSYQWKKEGSVISSGTVNAGNGQTLTYTINSVAVSDAGNYTLTIGNTTSSAARLNVSPRIISTGDPAGSYTLYYGTYNSEVLSLSITSADGEATLTYQWYKNDVSLGTSNGANTATFTKTIANGDSGTYKCIVSNAYGTATTGNFVISALNGVPSITSQPVNALVNNNATATFSISATANGVAIGYQWKKGGVDVNGATSSSYTTGALTTANDNDSYTCSVYTNFGSVTSNAVSSKIRPYITSIITSPNPLVLSNGATPVAVQCYASGSGTLKYSWFRNAVAVSTMQDQSANLTGGHQYVFTLTESTRGSYTCTVTSNHDSTGVTGGPIYAYMTPRVVSGVSAVTVNAGQNATFTVSAEGTTPLTYIWKKNGVEIQGADQNSSGYTLVNATSANNGESYSCTVQNTILGTTYSTNSASGTLTVNYAPTNASISGQTSYYVGNQMSFIASVTLGNPTTTTYTWQRSTDNGASWAQVAQNVTTSSSNQYDPGAATGAMIGYRYRCVISNTAGSVTTGEKIIYIIATVTVEPTDTTVNEGGTAVFSLTAEGNSPITYQWYRAGSPIGTSANAFADSDRQRANSGNKYYCVVSNAGGSDTSAERTLTVAYVIEQYNPDSNWYNLPGNGEINLYDGSLQAIKVVPQNYTSNSYQWQKFDGTNWNNISGANGNELVWNPITTADAGTYRCVISNSLNGSPMYSAVFIITVV